jgi:hypothetical protein
VSNPCTKSLRDPTCHIPVKPEFRRKDRENRLRAVETLLKKRNSVVRLCYIQQSRREGFNDIAQASIKNENYKMAILSKRINQNGRM